MQIKLNRICCTRGKNQTSLAFKCGSVCDLVRFLLLGVSHILIDPGRYHHYHHHHLHGTSAGMMRLKGNLPNVLLAFCVPVFSSPAIQVHALFLDQHEKDSISDIFINLLSPLLMVRFSELSVKVSTVPICA